MGDHPTTQTTPGEFGSAWSRFVASLRKLLSGAPAERLLDPYMELRDRVLDAADSDDVLSALEQAWTALHGDSQIPAHLLLTEISAFPASVQLAESEGDSDRPPKKRLLLSIAKTTVDSLRDILELSKIAKGVLKVLGEVIELFRAA